MELSQTKPHFSIPSIIAICCAIASLFVRPGLGILLAVVAIAFGVFGFALSFSPSIRGGVTSVFSMILASIGVILAILKAVFRHF